MSCEYFSHSGMPMGMMTVPGVEPNVRVLDIDTTTATRWFSSIGGVVYAGDQVRAYVGDTLVGQFRCDEVVERDLLLSTLAQDPRVHLGHLAKAFDISSEMLRRIRRTRTEEGVAALVVRGRCGAPLRLNAQQRSRIERRFESGASIDEVAVTQGKKGVSRATIGRVHKAWKLRTTASVAPAQVAPNQELTLATTPELPAVQEHANSSPVDAVLSLDETTADEASDHGVAAAASAANVEAAGSPEESQGRGDRLSATEVESCVAMQHAGTWLLIAMVTRLGLHEAAESSREGRVVCSALRLALDACIAALALGEKCVEGVRRLATPSAGALLRADHAPAATWVRRVLGAFSAQAGGASFHLRMLGNYLHAQEHNDDAPDVFYVDNHLRAYTGKEVIRRGWRMQDKRVKPGCTDFYVHDVEGNPVYRYSSPEHASLTEHLTPVARLLRMALGVERKILLAFDRGGSFPTAMAELRDEGFDFVTYERKPYALLASTDFTRTIILDEETYGICERRRRNLRAERGRVRRIAVRTPEGRQINVLAVSEQSAEWLVQHMFGRWVQENAFKHGVERWGINQLDGRTTEDCSPDAIIPNPANRRLTNARRIACIREGDARRELARLENGDPKRAKWESQLKEAMKEQEEIEARLPAAPPHARLADTELAGKLVAHTAEYKVTIDTVRIACTNAEADLAEVLAKHMSKHGEAKRALRNLFMAPGRVRVNERSITVELMPAGTRSELDAFQRLFATVNTWQLKLPGDDKGRRLVFRAQLQ